MSLCLLILNNPRGRGEMINQINSPRLRLVIVYNSSSHHQSPALLEKHCIINYNYNLLNFISLCDTFEGPAQ